MPSELISALFKRRSDVDSAAQTWESCPTESNADASHLATLRFDAPSAQDWLKSLELMPEEDLLADALNEGLAERLASGAAEAPKHAPKGMQPEDSERLQCILRELAHLQDQYNKERSRLGEARDELKQREAELRRQEAELEAEKQELRIRDQEKQNYPKPDWLVDVDGVMNIAIVGNSGVGKSLLINRLRRLRPHANGWAPVGVTETTLKPTMYPFPNQPAVRLWDLPGSGTVAVPSATYLQDMGLRYFDHVLIVSAGRFTETEVELRAELEQHKVPYYLVRSKVDIDIWNNKEDNFATQEKTLQLIREDLEKIHGVQRKQLYLISSRDQEEYDMPRLMSDLFPGLRSQYQMDPSAPAFCPAGSPGAQSQQVISNAAWQDSWALPSALSVVLSGLQGRWRDQYLASYLIQNDFCHVTLATGNHAVAHLQQQANVIWWCARWYVDEQAVFRARQSRELRWTPSDLQDKPLVWYWDE